MSGQHWIDELFRRRLSQRSFPPTEAELDQVRALLAARNGTAAPVRTPFSFRWWHFAVLPAAGMLLWALAGEGPRTPSPSARTSDATNAVATLPSGDPRTTLPEDGAIDGPGHTSPSTTVAPTGSDAPRTTARTTTPQDHALEAPGSATQAGGSRTVAKDRSPERRPTDVRVLSATKAGTRLEHPSAIQRAPAGVAVPASGTEARAARVDKDAAGRPQDMASTEDARNTMSGAAKADVLTGGTMAGTDAPGTAVDGAALERSTLDRLALRNTTLGALAAPAPHWREIPEVKTLASTELHLFGAPLLVRASVPGSGTEAGSVVGLEYRVRLKRITWSTGLHFGTYGVNDDQGGIDVRLSYVQVPVLGGIELGRGRFGALIEGGVGVDLLFSSKGTYPLEQADPSDVLPDDVFRSMNLSWILRPQAAYRFTDVISIGVGPLLQGQLLGTAREGGLSDARISAAGVSIGLNWRLTRHTY
jgi:hypothetical protein